MNVKQIAVRKQHVTTIDATCTLEEALAILQEAGYRCVPILDETGTFFMGNIYQMHLYRHKANGGDMTEPVTTLLKNQSKYIYVDSSFFTVFFTIKELPYIAVLDDDGSFYGILTHSALLNILAQSWDIKNGRYVLTIASPGKSGDLATMTKIISKYSNIASCITLDVGQDDLIRRTMITLPTDTHTETLDTIVHQLEKKEFQVVEIEDLSAERKRK